MTALMRPGSSTARSTASASWPMSRWSSSRPSTRRYRHYRQSRQPPRQGSPPRHPRDRRQALLPAQILTRPQSDRTGLRQAQAPPAQGRRPHRRDHLRRHRPAARCIHRRGMLKLLPKCRIQSNLTSSRFRPRKFDPATPPSKHQLQGILTRTASHVASSKTAAEPPWFG